jgi:hypothetical protein
MSYEAYLRNKLKEFVIIKGPPPSREASEITFMNAQRAAVTESDSIVVVKESQPKMSQYYGSNPSEVSFSCEKTVVKGGSQREKSADAVLARQVGATVCCANEKAPNFVTIAPTVYQKLFYPTELPSFYVWFDATDASTLYSNEISAPTIAAQTPLALNAIINPTTQSAIGGYVTAWKSKDGRFQAQLPAAFYSNDPNNPIRTANGIAFRGKELSIYDLVTGELGITVNAFLDSGLSVFLVAQTDTINGASTVFLDREGDASGNLPVEFGPTFVSTAGTVTYRYDADIQTSGNATLPTIPTEGTEIPGSASGKAMLYFDHTSTKAKVYVNGAPISTNLPGRAKTANLNYTTFGRRLYGATPAVKNNILIGNLATPANETELYEVYMFRTVLSTEERQLMEGFLATKHGFTLPYNHPYYWTPVLQAPFQRLEDTIEKPCKPCYKPGILFTGGPQLDPFRGNTKPVFARNKNCSPSGCSGTY